MANSGNEPLPPYTRSMRAFEWASILLNFGFSATLLEIALRKGLPRAHEAVALLAATWILADLISGWVHWMADTWGSPRTPVVGPMFIRAFREHHVDPLSITRHDWVETNGANFFTTVPILGTLLAIEAMKPGAIPGLFILSAISLNFWVVLTNQVHKWAHTPSPPKTVSKLQELGLLLPPSVHSRHHRSEHDRYYCITSGFLNRPLERIGFFKGLEKQITRLTGRAPRT